MKALTIILAAGVLILAGVLVGLAVMGHSNTALEAAQKHRIQREEHQANAAEQKETEAAAEAAAARPAEEKKEEYELALAEVGGEYGMKYNAGAAQRAARLLVEWEICVKHQKDC